MDKKYLTVEEAAEYIGTTKNYLYKLTSNNKIPYYQPTGRKCLFKREELDVWIEKGRISTNDEIEQRAVTGLTLKQKNNKKG